jgi:hypothetical protein
LFGILICGSTCHATDPVFKDPGERKLAFQSPPSESPETPEGTEKANTGNRERSNGRDASGKPSMKQAQADSERPSVAAKSPEVSRPTETAKIDESAVLDFARQEEPQLFELLNYLKAKRPPAFQQALRETSRQQLRLESIKQKDTELYAIEHQLWRIRSKLSFVVAEMSVRKSDSLDSQLVSLVEELEHTETQRIQLMKLRAQRQLEKWAIQLESRQADSDQIVQKSIDSWRSKIKKMK